MTRTNLTTALSAALLLLGVILPLNNAVGQINRSQPSDIEGVNAASAAFIAAIAARDINAMEKLWAHERYATFIGPLSTTVVVGWDGVRQAWEMRFSQFDRVAIRWQSRTFTAMASSRGRLASRLCSCFARMAGRSVSMPS